MNALGLLPAIRSLRRRPAFALAAILTIALGVGANIAVFNVIYGVLLQPLPFRDPAKLVALWESTPALPQLQVTYPDFQDWQARSRSFQQMAAYTLAAMNRATLLGQGEPEPVHATMASHQLFPMMGIQPLFGRAFTAEEERTQAHVGLISEDLWRRKFGADPAIAGRQIRLDTLSFTVVGVISRRQAFPEWADFWMPLSFLEPELQERRKYHPLEVVARLNPSATAAMAQADVASIARSLAREHPDTNGTVAAYAIPLQSELTGDARPSLLLVWAAVGLVLLIASANLAHLLLARMMERRREMEIRCALGAGPASLVRQILVESLLLALPGGALGAIMAVAASRLLRTLAAGQIPRLEWAGFHAPVWIFAVAVSLVCGVLFGLPACWQTLRANVAAAPPGSRSVVQGRSRFGSALVMLEVAGAFLVVAGALLLFRGFAALLREDPGFRAQGVLAVQTPCRCAGWDQAAQFFDTQLLPALRAFPGVEEVAAANAVPMGLGRTEHSRFASRFAVEGQSYPAGEFPVAQLRWVTPGYFRVLGIPLLRGAWLTALDRAKPRYLINETLARRWFANDDPSRHRILMGVMDPQQTAAEIAGVVGDVREFGLEEEAPPIIYQIDTSPVMNLFVKTNRPGAESLPAIRNIIRHADPEIAVGAAQPLERYVDKSLARRRFALALLAAFGALAAVLTAAGVYGLLAYSVSARLREFGVRAAIGASPAELLRMILREAVFIALPGILAGAFCFLAFARWMKSLVLGLTPADPVALIDAALLLSAITLLSAGLPGKRAAATLPADALRAE
jgi:predicted permease